MAEGRRGWLFLQSCIWIYHARYDFVILLIPAVLLVATPINRQWVVESVALVFVAIWSWCTTGQQHYLQSCQWPHDSAWRPC